MFVTDYAHLSSATLCDLVLHLTRREQDMEERLTAWENQAPEMGTDRPDPIRKRLSFLLLKQRRHRLAAEKSLATRPNTVGARSFSLGQATAASGFMFVAPDTPGPDLQEHPAPVLSPRSTREQQMPTRVDPRKRAPPIHGVAARIREAFTGVLSAARGRRPRFALPRLRQTS